MSNEHPPVLTGKTRERLLLFYKSRNYLDRYGLPLKYESAFRREPCMSTGAVVELPLVAFCLTVLTPIATVVITRQKTDPDKIIIPIKARTLDIIANPEKYLSPEIDFDEVETKYHWSDHLQIEVNRMSADLLLIPYVGRGLYGSPERIELSLTELVNINEVL